MTANNSKFYIGYVNKFPAGTRRPMELPWRFPEGPNIQDLQGIFRGLLGDQHKIWQKVFEMQ